jgi:hypothetical protein
VLPQPLVPPRQVLQPVPEQVRLAVHPQAVQVAVQEAVQEAITSLARSSTLMLLTRSMNSVAAHVETDGKRGADDG